MTDKPPPVGWVVRLTIPALPPKAEGSKWIGRVVLGPPSFQYFNVAVAAPEGAIAATTKHLAAAGSTDLSVVRGLSAAEIGVLRLKTGEVKPA